MVEAVQRGIEEVRAAYPESTVVVTEDGQGGARLVVGSLDLGAVYDERIREIGFAVSFHYDACDVYPHHVIGQLVRADGMPLGAGFSPAKWNGVTTTQVSRRSNRWQRGVDTAAMKLEKVLRWIRAQ